jgi:hypothetical protein
MSTSTTRKRLGIGIAALALAGGGIGGYATLSGDGGSANASSASAGHARSTARVAPKAMEQAKTAKNGITSLAASSRPRCPYPYVCFYKGNTMTGKFKDTGYWQRLGASRSSKGAMNTRHDDVAYVRFSNYHTICMKPREGWAFGSAKPTQVYISKSSRCH